MTLDQLVQEADLRTLRKAYDGVLLKWRGHRLPTLAELSAESLPRLYSCPTAPPSSH